MEDYILIRVIAIGDGRELKVVWNYHGDPFEPYFISRSRLERHAKDVRKKLEELVTAVLAKDGASVGGALAQLRQLGGGFCRAFFKVTRGPQEMKEVRNWFRALKGNPRIRFSLESALYLPWGLMYGQAALSEIGDGDGGGVNVGDYDGFWCLKYGVSATYHRVTPAIVSRWNQSAVGFLAVVNSKSYREAHVAVREENPAMSKAIDAIMNCGGKLVMSKVELFGRWASWKSGGVLLYFYCHSTGDKLALSGQEAIDVGEWVDRLGAIEDGEAPTCVAILNGCLTATGSVDGGFLEATGGDNFCGFVGTEASVPDLFALRFGAELVGRLLTSGTSIGEIVDDMLRAHWPLSILYSVNCPPNIRIAEDGAVPLPTVGGGNYSGMKVGSSVLVDKRKGSKREVAPKWTR